ncbi:Methyltransferase domain-containing protein [Catalinimonas alkaloidigena]|uniref:Arsenite methyltransferase n=1 Tax=Catalinimonas alkaloidigena TaxID=1075417 RepID=A0A1G8ZUJ6_9BACT|nr:arsenite methyltransferase [Catalinimonas alkaloidigena]SDK18799.1 Methyltransferase domain-containing protein [Catalinimonas alkaloidigena]
MENQEALRQLVREKYGKIAEQTTDRCCGPACGCGPEEAPSDYTVFAEDYTQLAGYNPDADLKLGCGLPTEYAKLQPGQTVVDLGSGAGNDCFIARSVVGETGRVIGLDMTEPMIAKAQANAAKLGFTNVEFVLGEIEAMPLPDQTADVVVSNCVMNLVPDKEKAFAETFRILKPGGHFSISDVVLKGDLPDGLQREAELYAGCVTGAIDKDAYLGLIEKVGFTNIQVQKDREIVLPDELLKNYLSDEELAHYRQSDLGIYSVTVYAERPAEAKSCCGPDCCN